MKRYRRTLWSEDKPLWLVPERMSDEELERNLRYWRDDLHQCDNLFRKDMMQMYRHVWALMKELESLRLRDECVPLAAATDSDADKDTIQTRVVQP